jgi:hypothetical protein
MSAGPLPTAGLELHHLPMAALKKPGDQMRGMQPDNVRVR